jgi:glucose/mannose-6-phosphate isomerase
MLDSLVEQYRWATQIDPPPVANRETVVVCGMGGSGISGDVASVVADDTLLYVHRGSGLPPGAVSLRPLVIAVSYSGNTEETRSAVDASLGAGLDVAIVAGGGTLAAVAAQRDLPFVAVPSGLQPRAAFGYLSGAVLRLLEAGGYIDETGLDEAATIVDILLGASMNGPAVRLADDIAAELRGRVALVVGSQGLSGVAAYRWKTQINENAKMPAFHTVLPETDHNEIVGWSTLGSLTSRWFGVVSLRDHRERDGIAVRFEPTLEQLATGASVVAEVWAQGESPLARLASLTVTGDLVSLALARHAGVDPIPVDAIESLKRRLLEQP